MHVAQFISTTFTRVSWLHHICHFSPTALPLTLTFDGKRPVEDDRARP